jgi:hypothetical protein
MLRIIVRIDQSSKLDPKEVTEHLACYYPRDQFEIQTCNEPEYPVLERAKLVVKKLRDERPTVYLCVGVSGGSMPFPTVAGSLQEEHAEHAAVSRVVTGRSTPSRLVGLLLAPDLSFRFKDFIKKGEESGELALGAAPTKETSALDGLVGSIVIQMGDWSEELTVPKH